MEACDNFIPEPKRDVDKPFLMPVEDVFSITGRGTVGTGRIESGIIKVGDEVSILGMGADSKTTVTGVEMFRKLLDEGQAGDNAGLLLRGIDKEDIQRGLVRAIGNPHERFLEDRLRMIRAVRYASRFHFDIEAETLKAILDHSSALFPAVAKERIWHEFQS